MKRFLLGAAAAFAVIGLVLGSVQVYNYVNRPLELVVYANAEELTSEIERLEKIKDRGRLSWRESFRLGVSYHQNTDYNNAVLVLEDFIKSKPDIGKAYETLGMSYYRLDKLTDAVEKWQMAVGLSSDGRFLEQMIVDVERTIAVRGRIKSIEQEIEQVKIQRESGNKNMKDPAPEVSWEKILELSLLYLGEKKFDEAIKYLEDVVKVKTDSPDLYDSLAQAYAMSGDFKKSYSAIKKAVALAPGDESLNIRYEEIKKINKAIKEGKFHNKDYSAKE